MAMAISTEKPQPIPWTHQETVHLIQSYQQKWYSLEKGQLKSTQWEELALTIANRCGYHHFHLSKTSTQCRHKMEKLRQRYRSEKLRISNGAASDWHFFHLMDDLLRGPLPISALPMPSIHCENDESDEEDLRICGKSRSISCIMNGSLEKGRGEMCSRLAAEIRLFGERLEGMEKTKMEMVRETERRRMEMERKRMEMVLESEQKIMDSIAKVFGSSKRVKIG